MKPSLAKQLVAIVLVGVFSQIALADNASAAKTIAGILVSLNHFPSDADKAALAAVASDETNGRGFQLIATAVSKIQHAATAEDKEIMNRIIASDRATPAAKALAEIVLGLSHMPSDAAKSRLRAML